MPGRLLEPRGERVVTHCFETYAMQDDSKPGFATSSDQRMPPSSVRLHRLGFDRWVSRRFNHSTPSRRPESQIPCIPATHEPSQGLHCLKIRGAHIRGQPPDEEAGVAAGTNGRSEGQVQLVPEQLHGHGPGTAEQGSDVGLQRLGNPPLVQQPQDPPRIRTSGQAWDEPLRVRVDGIAQHRPDPEHLRADGRGRSGVPI